jgi:SAM-dependent methyltransferase
MEGIKTRRCVMNDKFLNIRTEKIQKGPYESPHYNRYEPTPYSALESLFEHIELSVSDRFTDFGCGNGRMNFAVYHKFQSSVTGIEMNEFFYQEAIQNKRNFLANTNEGGEKVQFLCCLAQDYSIDPQDNVFYFFNPFSVQIFIKVINNIQKSIETTDRPVMLILYYAPEDYIFFLENRTMFQLQKEIILPGNEYEKFLIYG